MMAAKAITRAAGLTTATLALGFAGVAMTIDPPSTSKPAMLIPQRRVSVRLLGSASGITGVSVPKHILAGERPRFFQVDEPSLVAVTLPGGKVITVPSTMTLIRTEVDVRTKSAMVVDIDLLPLPKSVSFREAVAELRRLMREAAIEPEEQMKRHLAEWPEDTPGFDPKNRPGFIPHSYRTGVDISESVSFLAKVRAADDGGWFLVLTFGSIGDASRAVWDINFKAANKPPGKENGDAKEKPRS